MTSLGFLYPGRTAVDDYVRAEQLLGGGVRLHAVRADATDATATGADGSPLDGPDLTVDAVPVPSEERLAALVEELRLSGAETVVWAGPGFALGAAGAHEQVRTLARAAGLPASSTSFGFAHAVRELGAHRVAVATVYGADLTERFTRFLTEEAGTEVVSVAGDPAAARPATDPSGGPAGLAALRALVRAADRPDAAAVLVPGTALRTAAHLTDLEADLGKPVLTANQVTVWEALRLTDRRVNAPGLGALFTREPLVQVPTD
ncbi:decarboxylase [Streptomyces sp. NPDC127068]|uniref:aspartate racemase/maleate isomerase family protein n=1 Tax=Streptomyces sp. NPDC127068 TaxID=3347127 RepID=UPI003648D462